jgi:hypothetical protein
MDDRQKDVWSGVLLTALTVRLLLGGLQARARIPR